MTANYFRFAGEVTSVRFDRDADSVVVNLRADDADTDYASERAAIRAAKAGVEESEPTGTALRVSMFDAVAAMKAGRIEGVEHADKGALVVVEGYATGAKGGVAWLNATTLTFAPGVKAITGLKALAEEAA